MSVGKRHSLVGGSTKTQMALSPAPTSEMKIPSSISDPGEIAYSPRALRAHMITFGGFFLIAFLSSAKLLLPSVFLISVIAIVLDSHILMFSARSHPHGDSGTTLINPGAQRPPPHRHTRSPDKRLFHPRLMHLAHSPDHAGYLR